MVRKITKQLIESAYRRNRIYDMRFRDYMSLEEIGFRENITRQAVEQNLVVTGGTGGRKFLPGSYSQTLDNEEWQQKHRDLSNDEIAKIMGLSYKTVSKHRGGYRHGVKKENSKVFKGYLWENKIIALLIGLGFAAEGMPLHHPFDILISGKLRVDVKSTERIFVSNPAAKTKYLRFAIGAKKAACDVYICVDARNASSPEYYIIPSNELRGNPHALHIRSSSNSKSWQSPNYTTFKNRWDILETL